MKLVLRLICIWGNVGVAGDNHSSADQSALLVVPLGCGVVPLLYYYVGRLRLVTSGISLCLKVYTLSLV